ncbi:hypothetical protein KKC1_02030 [Calderihabitans maritimus]|uniref:Uncharacterized protein n=1 Tax=Calderihabitans maritimus TaxID=1246530 RepID=A0A1Z5HNZ0_9FIRM|nr:hypothetical protein KKC1_02030 [Calderihabitans maritimus]
MKGYILALIGFKIEVNSIVGVFVKGSIFLKFGTKFART